ncbi:hypothetical protein DN53_18865 [Flagellimonas olearia]|uniref:Uncharacterized protein n=1 Tax=Flagellimonas olearia TaxID=552546 RepID=A0A444VIS7_9FLAO|nr:hypothetical protein DN53_18865 [Allomuricauda olearia]
MLPKGGQLTNGRLELTKGRLELTKKCTNLKILWFLCIYGQVHELGNEELRSMVFNKRAAKNV